MRARKSRNYYIKLAITGTGQQINSNINIFKISDYLQYYAEIVAKDNWELWLECLGLSSIGGIKNVVQELRSGIHGM